MGTEGLVACRDGSCLHRNRNCPAGHPFWQEKEVESTGQVAGVCGECRLLVIAAVNRCSVAVRLRSLFGGTAMGAASPPVDPI